MKKINLVVLAMFLFITYSQAVNLSYSPPNLAALDVLRGESGKLKVVFCTPNSPVIPPPSPDFRLRCETENGAPVDSVGFEAPHKPGVYRFAVEYNQPARVIEDLRLITLVPFSAKQKGRIGQYTLGTWPFEQSGVPTNTAYANPVGFVEVTLENRNLHVSAHFKLGDFLTKDQPDVWPKYMLLAPGLIDKLELIIGALEEEGCDVKHMTVMSGFRTPRYNKEGGNTGGRGKLSRHMYGDAADIFLDNDRDGWTDDINHDGRVDIKDAEFLAQAAERVEARYPNLVGGIGIYCATGAHGPFIHVDVRGWKARWRGTNG